MCKVTQRGDKTTLTIRRGIREITADAGRTAALAIAGAADAAVGAAASAIAGLAPGGSSRPHDPADITHGHAKFGSAQGRLRVYMGDDAATTTAAPAATAAAAAAGTGRRGAIHATTRKGH